MPLDPEQLTIVALLLAIGGAGLKKLWVFGWQYIEMKEDRDRWRDIALRGTELAERATKVATRKTDG